MPRTLPIYLTALTLAATPVLADEITEYGAVGDWKVLIDADKGNGCFVQKEFEDGTLVQMGYWPARNGGFFGVYNAAWDKLHEAEDGTKTKIKFDFPDKRFVGDAERHLLDDKAGGFVFFDNPHVPDEIAKNIEMTILTESGPDIPINLKGTSNAIKSARECQGKQPE